MFFSDLTTYIIMYAVYAAQLGFGFLCGACAGSAILCWQMRRSRGESWVRGRSHCESCETVLSARDLVPVISYLLHKGHCRHCGAEIPSLCLRAELLFGLSGLLLFCCTLPAHPLYRMSIAAFAIAFSIMSWLFVTKEGRQSNGCS